MNKSVSLLLNYVFICMAIIGVVLSLIYPETQLFPFVVAEIIFTIFFIPLMLAKDKSTSPKVKLIFSKRDFRKSKGGKR